MAIHLIEAPFNVAGGWLEYTCSVCLWWAVGKERPLKSRELYLSKHAQNKIWVYKLPVQGSCY